MRRMLEDSELTLKRAVDICRACENTRATCEDLRGPEVLSVARVSAYKRGRSRSRGPRSRAATAADQRPDERCSRCGRRRHADPDTCRAADATCRACGQLGHFAAVCRQGAGAAVVGTEHAAAPSDTAAPLGSARGPPARSGRQVPHGHVRRVIADVSVHGVCARPVPTVMVQLSHQTGRSTLRCTPGTGAEATVMGDAIARSIGIDVCRLQTYHRTTFTAVGRRPLECLGAFGATLRLGDISTDSTVYVITGLSGVLLSWFDSVALGILPADFPAQI